MKNYKNILVYKNDQGRLVTTSLGIARKLGWKHHDVLRLIYPLKQLKEFPYYFTQTSYVNAQKKTYTLFEITKNGLLLMPLGSRESGRIVVATILSAFERYRADGTPTPIIPAENNSVQAQKAVFHQKKSGQQAEQKKSAKLFTNHSFFHSISRFVRGFLHSSAS